MSDYGLAIWIMVLAIFISVIGISWRLNTNECPDCPSWIDRYNNNTLWITADIGNKAECIEIYGFAYHHSITANGKCSMEIWKADLQRNLTDTQIKGLE